MIDLEARVTGTPQTAAVLAPLRDTLGRVERQVATPGARPADQFAPARRAPQPRSRRTTEALRAETARWRAPLNASTVRGTWGEVQLRRVLELPACWPAATSTSR